MLTVVWRKHLLGLYGESASEATEESSPMLLLAVDATPQGSPAIRQLEHGKVLSHRIFRRVSPHVHIARTTRRLKYEPF